MATSECGFLVHAVGENIARRVNLSKLTDLKPVLWTIRQQKLGSSWLSLYFYVTGVPLCLPVAGGRVIRNLHLHVQTGRGNLTSQT